MMPGCPDPAGWLPHLNAAMDEFQISESPERVAAFVAQIGHESSDCRRLEEGLTYTTVGRLRAVWPKRFPTDESAAPFVRNPQALAILSMPAASATAIGPAATAFAIGAEG